MKLIKTTIIALMILFVFVLVGCASTETTAEAASATVPAAPATGQTQATETVTTEKTTQATAKDTEDSLPIKTDETEKTGELKEFQVSAFRYGFSPDPIVVNKGDKVRLIIKSEDVKHGLAIPDFGVDAEIIPGKTTTIEFLADKQGEFTIFCSVFCGTGHSAMKGSLVVK